LIIILQSLFILTLLNLFIHIFIIRGFSRIKIIAQYFILFILFSLILHYRIFWFEFFIIQFNKILFNNRFLLIFTNYLRFYLSHIFNFICNNYFRLCWRWFNNYSIKFGIIIAQYAKVNHIYFCFDLWNNFIRLWVILDWQFLFLLFNYFWLCGLCIYWIWDNLLFLR